MQAKSASEVFDSIADAADLEPSVEGLSVARAEEDSFEQQHLKEMLLDRRQDREERKRFSKWIFILAASWMSVVALLLALDGFGSVLGFFSLDPKILEVLLGATTLKILGLMWLVTNYLFNDRRIPGGATRVSMKAKANKLSAKQDAINSEK